MLKEDRILVLQELCHIAQTRNELNKKRMSALYKKQYYSKKLKAVKQHSLSKVDQSYLGVTTKHPGKWLKIPKLRLRSLILKHMAEYVNMKHKIMDFSLKNKKKTARLHESLDSNFTWNDGYINGFVIYDSISPLMKQAQYFDQNEIKKYASEYRLNKATDKFLSGGKNVVKDKNVLLVET